MTETEKKALALVNEIERQEGLSDLTPRIMRGLVMDEALCRAIEQHEAFKREVSDAIDSSVLTPETEAHLSRFIIAKPDEATAGLALAVEETLELVIGDEDAKRLRAAIEARGGRIVWEGE